ncbi:hypothetical protein [Streptosporangium pseudovulgare]|uniref:Asl1-like glycosyl hydrolase catalytic domain-containing protein n=1 Tax=Streptosporangium pseudovulgare TaxID=35765 RepID=A0ABQ2R7Q1_9ACTN|nr:hypothetical protein [Streptosporangium pseudovulgare]GGQ17963.1 hypothetical protein GCM10010140_55430 [Streptosporangium pseudovulgare]
MRVRGVTYETGFLPGNASRPEWHPEAVGRDIRVIADELHCTAVRITGGTPERLSLAAELAAAAGLEVWFSPFPVDLDASEMLALYADCARRAEAVRRAGAEVVFVPGCESSAFGHGFLPGATYQDRLTAMAGADPAWWQALGPVMERFNAFLGEVAAVSRKHFGGRVTYAAGPWEFVDWAPFDLVGIDAYRAAHNAAHFSDELRDLFSHGKPVAVTEFGTCPYAGAGDRGGMAWEVPAGAVRDETEQVRYFTELTDAFEGAGVDASFWFTFAAYNRTGHAGLGSYGVVETLDPTTWKPRKVFHTMAARYANP